jgi:hypothetical protein
MRLIPRRDPFGRAGCFALLMWCGLPLAAAAALIGLWWGWAWRSDLADEWTTWSWWRWRIAPETHRLAQARDYLLTHPAVTLEAEAVLDELGTPGRASDDDPGAEQETISYRVGQSYVDSAMVDIELHLSFDEHGRVIAAEIR